MDFLISAFNLLIYQPLFNALVFLYSYLPGQDFGIAIIVLTVLIKFILYPLSAKGIRAQKALQEIQPKIKALQEKFKNDKEKQVRAVMEFYKKEKVNPFSSILPLLVQLPILIGLFRLFTRGFGPEQLEWLYSFVQHPGQIDTTFLGVVDLTGASVELAVLAGIFQFIQAKMLAPKKVKAGPPDFSQMLQKQMIYFFPFFTVFLLLYLIPISAIALYWLTITIFTVCQQYITLKKYDSGKSGEN
jgi:YidC/Oxa1 family membrane protein insertase